MCATRAGRIELLPALPETLRKGTLRGVRARTFVRIDELVWDLDVRRIELTLTSLRDQQITLLVRHGIGRVTTSNAVVEPVKPGNRITAPDKSGSLCLPDAYRKDRWPRRNQLSN